MIAAASASPSSPAASPTLPSASPQSQACTANNSTTPATDAGREASAARDAGAAAAAHAAHANTGEDPTAASADEAAPDFAELVAGNAPRAAAGARPPRTAAASEDDDAPTVIDLPDQLLSLLAGGWSATPEATQAAQPVPAGTDPLAGLRTPVAHAAPAAGAAGDAPVPAAANAPAGAGATLDASMPETVAAAATIAATDAAALPADDATAPASPDPLQAAAPLQTGAASLAQSARPVVAAPGAPLPMPANPDAGFDDGFGARIAWMAEQRLGHAEIRLNPEHVGPIDVRLQLDGNRVSAEFHSAHAEVRQAIEASVPRLREMLGQQGLQLGQADVGQRHAQGQPAHDGRGHRGVDAGGAGTDAGTQSNGAAPRAAALRSRGLLDEYA